MDRLGRKFWGLEEWAEPLGLDNRFRSVEATDLRENAKIILDDLDDLGVLLMFSVFEANVRDKAWTDVKDSLTKPLHPAVDHAITELRKDIETGSFGRVTEMYKNVDHDLVERVNQVRRYRNWVAHGRRRSDEQPHSVTPEEAYERLVDFLKRMAEVAIPPNEDADAS